jgi:hypothetical protein
MFNETLNYDIDECPECGKSHKKGEMVIWNKCIEGSKS